MMEGSGSGGRLTAEAVDWLVVSLARTPGRLAAFKAHNADLGLAIETLEASDGLTLDRDELIRDGLIVPELAWSMGAIGAGLSHRRGWQRAVASGRAVCMFEDDVVLRHDFAQKAVEVLNLLPAGWEIALLGYNTDSIIDIEIAPGCAFRGGFTLKEPTEDDTRAFAAGGGPVVPIRVNNAFATCAYVVSPRGASRLLEEIFPLEARHIEVPALNALVIAPTQDTLMNGLFRSMLAFACVPQIAMPLNDRRVSTVVRG